MEPEIKFVWALRSFSEGFWFKHTKGFVLKVYISGLIRRAKCTTQKSNMLAGHGAVNHNGGVCRAMKAVGGRPDEACRIGGVKRWRQ